MEVTDVDASSELEIDLVASRMRETLIEVLGPERGAAMYPMDWLRARVRWHLDASARRGRVLVAREGGEIVGHAIAREDRDPDGVAYGHFSTIYVAPSHRRRRVAVLLMDEVERWLASLGLSRVVYETAEDHQRLIRMFERRGYRITLREGEMVRLTRER